MGLFNLFKNNKDDNINKWEDFCNLDLLYKDEEKYKPIYYLKIYGKNEVNNNLEIKEKAKKEFIKVILNGIKDKNNPIIKCLIDYLIFREEIVETDKLLSILNDMNIENLKKISNTHTFYSYIETKDRIKNLNSSELRLIIDDLIFSINNNSNLYNLQVLKYTNELKKYLYNVYENINYTINSNIRYEYYKFNNQKNYIYFYENGIIVTFNDDESNLVFVYNKFNNLDNVYKIKRLLFINDELFSKNCIQLILENEVPSFLENEFYSSIKPYYVFNHEKYGEIEFYYNSDGIELKNKELDNNIFTVIQVYDYKYDTEKYRLLYIHSIERIIELKDKIIDLICTNIFNKCIEWNEKDENGNDISIEYIKNCIKFYVSIDSKLNDDDKELIKFSISGSTDNLLGGHSFDAIVENDKINCFFQ